MTEQRLYRIGELAELSGLPVKTIRHYSDIGVLPPAKRTGSGYRMYSDRDRVRLEIVRTLRSVGFDLATIGELLTGEGSVAEAVRLQRQAIDLQLRALQRQRAVLQHVEAADEDVSLETLERLQSLARLTAMERDAFVASHLDRAMADVPVDPEWKAWLWRSALADLPDELDEGRLQAWLDLAELVSDEDFLRALQRQARWFWESVVEGFDIGAWQPRFMALMGEVIGAVRAGEGPRDRPDLVERYLALNAEALGGEPDRDLAARILAHADDTHDPRGQRFWDLVAILQGREPSREMSDAFWWLMDGLRQRVGDGGQARSPKGTVG